MINWKSKYLKYKLKYINAKHKGGMENSLTLEEDIERLENEAIFLNELESEAREAGGSHEEQFLKIVIREYRNYPDILNSYLIDNNQRLRDFLLKLSYKELSNLIYDNMKSYLIHNLINYEKIENVIDNHIELKKIKDIGDDAQGLLSTILILSYNVEIITKTLFDLYKIYYTILNINNICSLLFNNLNLILIEKYEKDIRIKRGINYTNVNYFIQLCYNNLFNDFEKIKENLELPQLLFFQILNDNNKKNEITDFFKTTEGRYLDFLKIYPKLFDILSKTNTDNTNTLLYKNLIISLKEDNIELFKQMFYEIKYIPEEIIKKYDGMFNANAFTKKNYSKHPFINYIYNMIEKNKVNLESIKNLDMYKTIKLNEPDLVSTLSYEELLYGIILPEVITFSYPDETDIDNYLNILFLLYKNLKDKKQNINELINIINIGLSYEYYLINKELL